MRILAGLAAAALVATTAAAPAQARHRDRVKDDVDAGDVVVGALVLGGIAALLSAPNEEKRARQDAAVDACTMEAERRLGADVGEILGVTRKKGYHTVRGLLDGGPDGHARPASFTCTVRNGSIYAFRSEG